MVTYYVVMQLSGGDLMRWKWFLLAAAFFYTTAAEAGEALSHYTGQEKREIKALSKEEIDGYISGDGMGFAKTAELNHYPGPRHVLDLADQLQLSGEQRKRTQAIFESMKSQAVSLGKQLVGKEQLLDSRFAEGTISDAELEQLVTEISVIQGKLRAVHLRAHLAQRVVLTPDQIRIYDALRGYQQPEAGDPHAAH
jgi:Spy/CpxP family protein refolding chaperone